MSAEPQVLLEAAYGPADYVGLGATAGHSTDFRAAFRNAFTRVTTMLECLWSFREAMRQGKPLPDAEAKLSQLGKAMGSSGRHS